MGLKLVRSLQDGEHRPMMTRTAFDIDCHPVIPEFGFACPKCIQEIETTLASKTGVHKVYMGEGTEEGRVIVEHDPAVATVDQRSEGKPSAV